MPGIGPVSAQRIIDTRKDHSINSMEQLRKMKVATRRAGGYIWFKGMLEFEKQMSFMPEVAGSAPETPLPELAEVVG